VARNFPYAQVVFGIIMGTGVGGGIVVNGQILKGHHGIGGEWGHMFLDNEGTDCYYGRHGCVETIISGTALEKFFFEKTGEAKKLKDILESDDDVSVEIHHRLITFFGKAVGQIINVIDPDVIVIGGGLGQIPFLYTEGVNEIAQHIFNDKFSTPVVPPILGDSAGVFGAAMLTYNTI
jgi:predicted NBD/HSP70 family sugar kinase